MPRPRRSENAAVPITIYVDPVVLDEIKQEHPGLSVGAVLESVWRNGRPGPMIVVDERPVYQKTRTPVPPKVAKSRPASPTSTQDGHVCRQFRWSEARHMNVCVEESCQKPKHR